MKRVEELETPAVLVDLDIVERNIQKMAAYVSTHGLKLRPHTKTHKNPMLAKMQVAAGAGGITVAKSGEAEVMASSGLDDILVAYPVFGISKWERLANIARERRVTVVVDSLAPAQGLAAAAKAAGSVIGLLVEFDVGMKRCGVSSPTEVLALAQAITKLEGAELRGVMFYPGQIWNLPADQGPALSAVSAKVDEVLATLAAAGLNCEIVSGGSTPTAYQSHLVKGATEIRPGTYIYGDRNCIGVGAATEDECALRVQMTVVSTSVPGRAILDGGSKTLTNDRWISGPEGHGLIVGHPDAIITGLSEEHGHVDLTKSDWQPKVGEIVTVIPNHVCACVNLHETLYLHRNGIVEGTLETAARGRVR